LQRDRCCQLTDPGLIDEYRLTLNPVILATGVGLFKDVRNRRSLTLIEPRTFSSGAMLLCYSRMDERRRL
jgi:hypothetical protein